jgi:predicted TIM-barrel fold metal-dependent hydrolase
MKAKPRIDAYQHFWHYDPAGHLWMTDQMDVLRRDYLPEDLAPLLASVDFHGTVAVQARQTFEETEWLLQISDQYDFIKGVVGWVDLRSAQVFTRLQEYSANPKLRGVRHVLHDEPDDQFMLAPEFQRGISHLREFNLAYDLLLFPKDLPVAVKLVEAFPGQPFVLDHIGKPAIRDLQISPWKQDLEALPAFPIGIINGSPFASGLFTKRGPAHWHPAIAEDRAVFQKAAEYCRKPGTSISKLALQFSSQHPEIPTKLFSSSHPETGRRNVEWHEDPCDAALLAAVQEILEPVRDQQWDY